MKQYGGSKGKADKLFSQIIRSQGRCECCGSTQNLQTAHIISRRFSKVRCDLRNAFCLCAKCHMRFTANPIEFAEYVASTWAQEHVPLMRERAYDVKGKVDWETTCEYLQNILDAKITLIEARNSLTS